MKTYTTDGVGRICLGKEFAHKMFSLKVEKGSISLVPVEVVPIHEAWLYKNIGALSAVQKGLQQAKEGKEKPLNFNLEDDDVWLTDKTDNK